MTDKTEPYAEALREALTELLTYPRIDPHVLALPVTLVNEMIAALSAQVREQQPVAWRYRNVATGPEGLWHFTNYEFNVRAEIRDQWESEPLYAAPVSAPVEQQPVASRVDALSAIDVFIREYIDGYEWDDGDGGRHMPTDVERALIADAIHGLLADHDFIRKFNTWQDAVRSLAAPVSAEARDVERHPPPGYIVFGWYRERDHVFIGLPEESVPSDRVLYTRALAGKG